jgi:hypothetical protein
MENNRYDLLNKIMEINRYDAAKKYDTAKNFIIILLGIATFFLYPFFLKCAYYLGVVPFMELFNVEMFDLQYYHFLIITPLIGCIKGYKLVKNEEQTIKHYLELFLTTLLNRFVSLLILTIISLIIF